eukprot:jgi/Chlat1/8845/Chrsp91S08155
MHCHIPTLGDCGYRRGRTPRLLMLLGLCAVSSLATFVAISAASSLSLLAHHHKKHEVSWSCLYAAQNAEKFPSFISDYSADGNPLKTADNRRAEKVLAEVYRWNSQLKPGIRIKKFEAMAPTAFALFRGTCHLYWGDFSGDWRLDRFGSPETKTWLTGDAHAYNFGVAADASGRIVFIPNDFDEGMVGDYQYDLWRLVASLVLIARHNDATNATALGAAAHKTAIRACALSYAEAVRRYRGPEDAVFTAANMKGPLSLWTEYVAITSTRQAMLDKWTELDTKGRRRFRHIKGKLSPLARDTTERMMIEASMFAYRTTLANRTLAFDPSQSWHVLDVAKRWLAGTGSLGTPRYYILLEGVENATRILDAKRQSPPVGFGYLSTKKRVELLNTFKNDGERHAAVYQALVPEPDRFLGYFSLPDGYYSVRERSPFKASYPLLADDIKKDERRFLLEDAKEFIQLSEQMCTILASTQLYAQRDTEPKMGLGTFRNEFLNLTAGHEDEFAETVWRVADEYALEIEADWRYCATAWQAPNVLP